MFPLDVSTYLQQVARCFYINCFVTTSEQRAVRSFQVIMVLGVYTIYMAHRSRKVAPWACAPANGSGCSSNSMHVPPTRTACELAPNTTENTHSNYLIDKSLPSLTSIHHVIVRSFVLYSVGSYHSSYSRTF